MHRKTGIVGLQVVAAVVWSPNEPLDLQDVAAFVGQQIDAVVVVV